MSRERISDSNGTNVYEFWIGSFPCIHRGRLLKRASFAQRRTYDNLFSEIDKMVERFLQEKSHRPNEHIVGEIPSLRSQQEYSILQLMTHVMTHEFHHKGQIMTMGRMLGYTPPDADVICF